MLFKFDNIWMCGDKTGKNKILYSSSKLLAAALARKVNNPYSTVNDAVKEKYNYKGIQYHAIGQGDPAWTADQYTSGASLSASGLNNEFMREIPFYCKFVEVFSSVAFGGNYTQLIDSKLKQYKPSDLNGRVLIVTGGTNVGESGTITYDPEQSILTTDVPTDKVYFSSAFTSGVDSTTEYSINNIPVSGTKITERVLLKTRFTPSQSGFYTIREHGLFGANATSTANSGIIFNVAMLSGTNSVVVNSGATTEFQFLMKLG